MAVKVIRIYELDSIINARLELVGSFFEVEVPAGPVAGGYINKRLAAEQFAALLGGYTALSLPVAQSFAAADDVQPNTFYGITGDWNATGTDTTVHLHGVRPDAYHRLGVVYDAQGVAQLVEADVVAGTYKVLGADKADLGPDGRVPVAQSRDVGFGLLVNPATGSYELDDQALYYYRPTQLGKRVNPANGAVTNVSGYELTQSIQTTPPDKSYVTPGQRYQSNVPLFYAVWRNAFGQYVGPWSASSTDASYFSVAPAGANYLQFSPDTGKIDGPPVLRITPAGLGAYDDTALKARVAALEVQGGRLRGPWAASTAYKQYDMVVQGGGFYYANAAFTSGSSFDASKWTAISTGSIGGGVATPSGTVLVFTQDAEYAPIYNGTFTVDTTGAKMGTTVFVELGAAATEPVLDANVFEPATTGSFVTNRRNNYGFKVSASGKIQYIVTQLP